jgi:hypothetical protein
LVFGNEPWRRFFNFPRPGIVGESRSRFRCVVLFTFRSPDIAHSTGSRLGIVGEEGVDYGARKLVDTFRVINRFTQSSFNCVKYAVCIQGQICMGVWQPELITYILVITMWVCLYCYETVFPRMLRKICCSLVSCI